MNNHVWKLMWSVAVMVSGCALTFGVTPCVSGSPSHTMALKADGTVWAAGNNSYGCQGDGSQTEHPTPVQIDIASVTKIVASRWFSLALKNDGTVWTWGLVGSIISSDTINDQFVPLQVSGLTSVQSIDGGTDYAIALRNDGTVWTWGDNATGQLGDGTVSYTNRSVPAQVGSLSGIRAISGDKADNTLFGSATFAMALKNDGTVWMWGANGAGQLGDGTTSTRPTPVQATGLTSVQAIDAGGMFGAALKTDGTIWTWGSNAAGQLGDGTRSSRLSPVQVSGLSGVSAIACGGQFSMAIKSDGTIWGWGSNLSGQLGDGTVLTRLTPVQVFQMGTLAINVTPSSGTWFLSSYPASYTGKTSGIGDLTSSIVPCGAYAVSFGSLPGYTSPASQTNTIADSSSVSFTGAYVAQQGDNPVSTDFTAVCADYDGDGRADMAIYQESSGNWYVKLSAFGYAMVTLNFGGSGYLPVPCDYDGDGKADPAVYQPATGTMYIKLSKFGYTLVQVPFE